MTTDEYQAFQACLRTAEYGMPLRAYRPGEREFIRSLRDLPLTSAQRWRLLRLAIETVPRFPANMKTPQQIIAINAVAECLDANAIWLTEWEHRFFQSIRFLHTLSPRQENRLFELADKRLASWRMQLNGHWMPKFLNPL